MPTARVSAPGSITSACAALASLLAAGCNVGEARLHDDPADPLAATLAVSTATAELGELFARYQATSNIAADGEAQVPARIDGEVLETFVEEGDRVLQGQLLARVDAERLELTMLESGARLEGVQSDYRRRQRLQERGLVSRASFENLEFEIAELEAAHAIDRYNHSLSEIRAPISGVVAARYIRPGEHVRDGELAFRISDTSRLVAKLKLPQREVARIKAGQTASVTVAAYPGRAFAARIARLSPVVDASDGTIAATAYIDNPDGALAPGMFGRFEIHLEKHSEALTVPSGSIVREDGDAIVYRVADGRAWREVVRLGVVAGARTQIIAGLDPGDEVVVSASDGIGDGTRVMTASARRIDTGS